METTGLEEVIATEEMKTKEKRKKKRKKSRKEKKECGTNADALRPWQSPITSTRPDTTSRNANTSKNNTTTSNALTTTRNTSSACLRWGNKGNIWFWHHWLPSLPLGHHYSNPSPRLST
jgi:hypothetical protein